MGALIASRNLTCLSDSIDNYPEGIIIPVDKPYRWTSADVIRKLKYASIRHFNKKNLKVGHAGTLDPLATGAIFGLTTSTRLPEIHRAIMEGITYEMRYNIEKLGIGIDRLFACGGGAQTPAWRNIKADILGRDVIVVKTAETGAMGSAILGFVAITGENPLEMARRFVSYGDTVVPDPENQRFYNAQYEKYKALRSIIK